MRQGTIVIVNFNFKRLENLESNRLDKIQSSTKRISSYIFRSTSKFIAGSLHLRNQMFHEDTRIHEDGFLHRAKA